MNCAVKEAHLALAWKAKPHPRARGVILQRALLGVEKAGIRDDLLVDDSRQGFLDACELFLGVKCSLLDVVSNLQ